MFSSAPLKFVGKVLIVVLAAFGVYLAYRYFTAEEPPPPFNNYKEHVIKLVAQKLTTELAGTKEKPRKLLLAGDEKNRVRHVIRTTLEESGRVEVLDPDFAGDAGQSVKDWFFSAVRSIVRPEEAKVARALAERSRADAILFTEVETFDDTDEETLLKVDYELQDIGTGKVHPGAAQARLGKSIFSLTYLQLWMWSTSRFLRALIWFLVALFAPLVTYKLAWSVMARGRNDYNALLVAGYTAVDTLLVWILLGFTISGFMASSLFVLALLGSATWSFLILDELEDLRH